MGLEQARGTGGLGDCAYDVIDIDPYGPVQWTMTEYKIYMQEVRTLKPSQNLVRHEGRVGSVPTRSSSEEDFVSTDAHLELADCKAVKAVSVIAVTWGGVLVRCFQDSLSIDELQ
eukprot:2110040-Amphidinium_carterae.1